MHTIAGTNENKSVNLVFLLTVVAGAVVFAFFLIRHPFAFQ